MSDTPDTQLDSGSVLSYSLLVPGERDEHRSRFTVLGYDRRLPQEVGSVDPLAQLVTQLSDTHLWTHGRHGTHKASGTMCTMRTTCSLPNCDRPEHARKFCSSHYIKLLGTPALPLRPRATKESRVRENTGEADPVTGCQAWLGNINVSGYGTFSLGRGNQFYAHRAAWELANGRPVPEGMQIDHECHNRDLTCAGRTECLHRRCVNPAHLAAVTNQENSRRSALTPTTINRAKTHCPRNHPYDLVNTYWRPRGGRVCRACARQIRQERKAQRGAAA